MTTKLEQSVNVDGVALSVVDSVQAEGGEGCQLSGGVTVTAGQNAGRKAVDSLQPKV